MSQLSSKELDGYHWHEAFDRASICMEMVDQYILFHPAVESVATLKEKAEKAHQLLFDLYQEIGGIVAEQRTENN